MDPAGLRILIIAPNSALGSWIEELNAEGETDIHVLEGTRAERLEQLTEPYRWTLAHPDIHLHIPEIADTEISNWDCVCLDESTSIKNYKSRRSRFWVNHFRDCPHRWVMTGTPNPEHLLEFWPQLAFCDGHAFGFRNFYSARQTLFRLWGSDWVPAEGTQSLITDSIAKRACIMRRSDYTLEPRKDYLKRVFTLPPKIRKVYDTAEKDFEIHLEGHADQKTMWTGARYAWLRQLAGGFMPGSGKLIWDEKIQDLIELLRSQYHEDHVVVWSAFLAEIGLLTGALIASGRRAASLTGSIPASTRRKILKDWNDRKLNTLVIQHQIGETGMRLSASDVSIYYSSPTGSLARKQTEDRIVHLEKLKRPLTIIDMVTQGTVDEDVLSALKEKSLGSGITMEAALRKQFQMRRRYAR
jgi:SNF2 family DNA or RNA helicase